jgi:phospholipid transport system transporter-binding protein
MSKKAAEAEQEVGVAHGGQGEIRLSGRLSMASVPELVEKSRDWFRDANDVDVDFSAISQSDSAGVALMLEWLRRARQHGCKLHYRNLPAQMRAIVEFGDLGDILPLADPTSSKSI